MMVACIRFQRQFLLGFCVFLVTQWSTAYSAPQPHNKNVGSPLFKALDGNRDGVLDPFEAIDMLLALNEAQPGQKLTPQAIQEVWNAQEEEKSQEMSQMLNELDANNDGRTELSEIDRDMREMAALWDQNKDGVLTIKEAVNADLGDAMFMSQEDIRQEIDHIFKEKDEDGNGQLTKKEASNDGWERLSSADTNKDGQVSKQELEAYLTINNTTASFTIKGNVAMMSGVISADTPAKVLQLVFQHPDVRTIELVQVPGSIDDEANLRAARYVRKFGFTTVIKSTGMIASGGTDFFLAGNQRQVEIGAQLGIHSWGGPGYQGIDVPRDDPQHRLYLDYYDEMEIPAAFYWRTLEAAPAEGIHWMTETELTQFKFRTSGKR